MSFRDFTFPEVQAQLGLRVEDADLFSDTPPAEVRPEFAAFVQDGVELAQAIGSEKAKSEFIIAPVLLELRRTVGRKFVLFSGLEWTVDAERGLNGFCDFIIGRSPSQFILAAPFLAIAEAKNDLIQTGLGQCIAAMVAARIANDRAGTPLPEVFGIVSTGAAWKFLRLRDDLLTLDVPDYFIDNLPKLMGILRRIVEPRPS